MDLDLYSSSASAGFMFPDFDLEFNFMEQISDSPLFSLIDYHHEEDDNNNGAHQVDSRGFDFPIELLLSMTTESESTESFSSSPPPLSSIINIIKIDDDDDDDNNNNNNNNNILRSPSRSVSEKMMKALSLFEEDASLGAGIGIGRLLAQVWVPIKRGNDYVLSTWEEPYFVDPNHEMLAGYRQLSSLFTFSSESESVMKAGCFRPGLPGRVFSSKLPEWCSNVVYYTNDEYLRREHALDHQVRGCMALPVFEDYDDDDDCAAVLELVTVDERLDFRLEMEKLCNSLQAVNLRSVSAPPRFHPHPQPQPQCLSRNQRAALAEITDFLRVVCHAHDLPLALTWLPCSSSSRYSDRGVGCLEEEEEEEEAHCSSRMLLCIEKTGCYVKDREMAGFVDACEERYYLEEGEGVAGKALRSDHALFIPDVKSCDISEYPLVHHARKFGLNAVVAFRLRSTYTGDDDYILELFLPPPPPEDPRDHRTSTTTPPSIPLTRPCFHLKEFLLKARWVL